MKISRNERCPCGSGKKYKNCCIDKTVTETKLFGLKAAIDILKQGLSNNSRLVENGNDWHIKEIKYLNGQSLLIEYYTEQKNPMDIKIEMGEIISFASSFITNDGTEDKLFNEIPLYFGVSALNLADVQLLYVMSSAEIAKKMAKGNSIEWIKNSYFEDTTDEFILKNSKMKISIIEKALRNLIFKNLNDIYGQNWIDKINNTDYQNMYKMYKRATGDDCRSSSEILDYSFLPNLKDIILNNFPDFQIFFSNKIDFENKMNKLNKIRREESHNREISHSTYKVLEELYDNILIKIVEIDDTIVPKYAIDNWHLQLFRIIDKMQKSIPVLEETDRGNVAKIFDSFRTYKNAVELTVEDLSNVLVPLSKKKLHDKLLELLDDLSITLSKMLQCGVRLETYDLQEYFSHYNNIMKNIQKYSNDYIFLES